MGSVAMATEGKYRNYCFYFINKKQKQKQNKTKQKRKQLINAIYLTTYVIFWTEFPHDTT